MSRGRKSETYVINVGIRLQGLLPLCSCCKQIRDDDGRWHRVEAYVQAHSDATFTHT